MKFSTTCSSVKQLNRRANRPKTNNLIVPSSATIVAPELFEKVEVEDYRKLAKDLQNASSLEIMDKPLEIFGNDIAIVFRYWSHTVNCNSCRVAYRGLNTLEIALQVISIASIGIVAIGK